MPPKRRCRYWASRAQEPKDAGANEKMSGNINRLKQFLFVDDDPEFLANIRDVFSQMSGGAWEISTAENHAQALAILQQHRMDVVVVDLDMPVVDGLQFLRLLARTHPGQQTVMWTGRGTEMSQKESLESGAALYLEKLITPEGFSAVFAALDALAGAASQEGFRGVMRRVGLQEVLQMECLGRKSSVLEIFTNKIRGRIFINEGMIVHAESGALQGEVALYGLLALRNGEFNFLPFTEPQRRTITGQWESLLMEAARLSDEGASFFPEATAETGAAALPHSPEPAEASVADAARPAAGPVRIEETLLCSGAGEVLEESGCKTPEERLRLLEQVERQAAQLSTLVPVGRFERLEIATPTGRVVCQVEPHMRLFVRSSTAKIGVA